MTQLQRLDLGENNISVLVMEADAAEDLVRRRNLLALAGPNGTSVSVFYKLSALKTLWLDRNQLAGL